MYAFKYERPTSVRQAASLLAGNEDAKLLAGGHSLIPVMKQRLASPKLIVDLSKIEGLTGIEVTPRTVTIKAMTKHRDVANSKELLEVMPALAGVPGSIGDPHVRQTGTIGGSVANNDPNADYPAACLGLGATIVTNKRKIAADDYFKGMFDTALEPDEIITEITFPIVKKAGYMKFKHPASGFALVGVFVSKRSSEIRVAATGAGSNGVFRVKAFEEALKKRFAPKSLEGITLPADGMNSDIHGSAEYRAHLVGVMARRAVAAANERGGEDEE
jgi:carbon-monoxide dehydrogenase medium subunit